MRPLAIRLLFVGVAAVLLVSSTAAARTTKTPPLCRNGLTTIQIDPRDLLPLTANSIGPSTAAALRFTRSGNPQVDRADLATVDHERGGEAKVDCGTRVWRRTVVVYITLRAFKNSASLSEKVFFVGRFSNSYRVWQVVH